VVAGDSTSVPAGVGVGVGGRLNDRTLACRRNAFDSGQVAARGRPHIGRLAPLMPAHTDRSGNSSASSLSCEEDRRERMLPVAGCVASRLTRSRRGGTSSPPVVLFVTTGRVIIVPDMELYRRRATPLTVCTSPGARRRPRTGQLGPPAAESVLPSRGDALRCRGLVVNAS